VAVKYRHGISDISKVKFADLCGFDFGGDNISMSPETEGEVLVSIVEGDGVGYNPLEDSNTILA
jgi:hypothetical protein